MKLLLALPLSLLAAILSAAEPVWLTDLDAAKAKGVKENKPVLVDFTGDGYASNALHKNVFESKEFAVVASKYVLVELDYPRNKPQAPELKAMNAALSKHFGISSFPTVLLIDAKSGEVFGKHVGFGRQSAKEYLEKLASFKNTPEGREALVKGQKSPADRSAKSREIRQKIDAAIIAEDFKAAESALNEIFADVSGSRKADFHYNKALILLQIDPSAKAQALKYVDEALAVAAGDERRTKSFKAYREKISSEAPVAPKSADVPKKGA